MSHATAIRLGAGLIALGLVLGATFLRWVTELGRIASVAAPETHPAVWARATVAFLLVGLALSVALISYLDGRRTR